MTDKSVHNVSIDLVKWGINKVVGILGVGQTEITAPDLNILWPKWRSFAANFTLYQDKQRAYSTP